MDLESIREIWLLSRSLDTDKYKFCISNSMAIILLCELTSFVVYYRAVNLLDLAQFLIHYLWSVYKESWICIYFYLYTQNGKSLQDELRPMFICLDAQTKIVAPGRYLTHFCSKRNLNENRTVCNWNYYQSIWQTSASNTQDISAQWK